jgi:hypothetical protein
MSELVVQAIGDIQIALLAEDPPEMKSPDGLNYTSTKKADEFVTVIATIVKELSEKLDDLPQNQKPDQIVLDLSIGLSQEMKLWVIGGKGEQKMNLKLTWAKLSAVDPDHVSGG